MNDASDNQFNNLVDWTKISSNPLDIKVREKLLSKINSVKQIVRDSDINDYVLLSVKDKNVLDVGLCEHDLSHVASEKWKHRRIVKAAKHCLGVDIVPDAIIFLKSQGFNVKLCDATSSEDLGERFDVVFIGDVIEHVSDPVKLLQFAARHLNKSGKIIVTTPNPFFAGYLRQLMKKKTYIANAEHVSWITPTNALEIGRRANVNLSKIIFPLKNPKKALLSKFLPLEIIQSYYIYEFVLADY